MKLFEEQIGFRTDEKGFNICEIDISITSDKKGTTMSVLDRKKQVQYTFAVTNEIKKEITNNEK